VGNLSEAAEALAKKKLDEAKAQTAAQAQQAVSNFSDPLIDAAQKVWNMASEKLAEQTQAEIQDAVDKVKNQNAETQCKSASKLESQLKDNVKEITLFPEKIPMNLTESLTTKVGKVAGLNQSEMTIEVQGGKFAKTAWLGRSIDAIGVEDTYGIKDSAVVNKSTSSDLTVAAVAIKKFILGEGGLKEDLPSIVKTSSNTFSISPQGLADRVKSVLGGSSSALNQLSKTLMQSAFSGNVDNAARSLMSQFDVSLNGTLSQFTSSNVSNAAALFEGINRLTKNSNFAQLFDTGAESQLLTSLFSEAISIKLPGAVDVLATAATSDTAVNQALKNVLGTALTSGDAATISGLTSRLGSNQILAMQPQAAATILSNYVIKPFTPSFALEDEADSLITLLNTVDPSWNTVNRNGEAISNLLALNKMSDDAKRVLSTKSEYRDLIEVSNFYNPETFSESIVDKYPLCPIV